MKGKKGHDSAQFLLLHPNTEPSSSLEKSCRDFQSHDIQSSYCNAPWCKFSTTARRSEKIKSLLLQSDCRYEKGHQTLMVVMEQPTWMSANMSQSDMSWCTSSVDLSLTWSPPDTITRCRPGLHRVLFNSLTRICCRCVTEPTVTDQHQVSHEEKASQKEPQAWFISISAVFEMSQIKLKRIKIPREAQMDIKTVVQLIKTRITAV